MSASAAPNLTAASPATAKVAGLLRSCLASSKDGVTLERVQRDYRQLVGENIPWILLGYPSLAALLEDFCRITYNAQGEIMVHAVATAQETAHVQEGEEEDEERHRSRHFGSSKVVAEQRSRDDALAEKKASENSNETQRNRRMFGGRGKQMGQPSDLRRALGGMGGGTGRGPGRTEGAGHNGSSSGGSDPEGFGSPDNLGVPESGTRNFDGGQPRFQTYPSEYPTSDVAENIVSQRALSASSNGKSPPSTIPSSEVEEAVGRIDSPGPDRYIVLADNNGRDNSGDGDVNLPEVLEMPGLIRSVLLPPDLVCYKDLVPPTLPDQGDFFDVRVSLTANPGNFTVQPWADGDELDRLQLAMLEFYAANVGPPMDRAEVRASVGRYFAARLPFDGRFYRVRLLAMLPDDSAVSVRFVDHGDRCVLAVGNLRVLWSQFRNLPMQAVQARLAGIMPTHGVWMRKEAEWFNRRVIRQHFVSVLRDVELDDDDIVNVDPDVDVWVEQELVDRGRKERRKKTVRISEVSHVQYFS